MPRTPLRWKDSIEERGLQKPLEVDVLLVLLCAVAARGLFWKNLMLACLRTYSFPALGAL